MSVRDEICLMVGEKLDIVTVKIAFLRGMVESGATTEDILCELERIEEVLS